MLFEVHWNFFFFSERVIEDQKVNLNLKRKKRSEGTFLLKAVKCETDG